MNLATMAGITATISAHLRNGMASEKIAAVVATKYGIHLDTAEGLVRYYRLAACETT